jgi:nitrate/nitrite-specific signal transduction histidine kinase
MMPAGIFIQLTPGKYQVKNRTSFYNLRTKTIISIVIITALCALVSGLIMYLVIQYEMTTRYGADKEAAIESLSYSLKPLLEAGDYQQVGRIIDANLIYQHIDYIAVYDSGGTLIGSDARKDAAAGNYVTESDLTESHDIAVDGTTIGRFEIAFSRVYINDLARQTTFILVATMVAFFLIAGVALVIFMKTSILQPLEEFSQTIGRIGPGDLSVRLKVKSRDEIGQLAESFNRMAGDLENSQHALAEARSDLERKVEMRTRGERRRAEQLREINEVSRRISAILSLDELLPYVANSLQQTFDYHNVTIFLFDQLQENLVLQAGASGDGKPVLPGLTVPRDDAVVGKVARSGEPVNTGSAARPEMAVPIKLGTEIFGVLDIQSIAPDNFDEIDLFTIQTLGDQLAVAVENARLYRESQNIAVLEERNRMAREIHDTLAQGFTGIVLQLEAAEQTLETDAAHAQQHLDRARSLAKESLNEARRSVWALRPQKLEQLPLEAAVRQETDRFIHDTDIPAVFSTAGDIVKLSSDIENALLRICQEALTNIRKHARANHVEIRMAYEEKTVRLSVHDDGIGFDPDTLSTDHFGLVIMRERAKLIGGTVEINSEIGKGTHLEVIIPLTRGAA